MLRSWIFGTNGRALVITRVEAESKVIGPIATPIIAKDGIAQPLNQNGHRLFGRRANESQGLNNSSSVSNKGATLLQQIYKCWNSIRGRRSE